MWRQPSHREHQLAAGDDVLQPGGGVVRRVTKRKSCSEELVARVEHALTLGQLGQ
jgi:hypothetical protein